MKKVVVKLGIHDNKAKKKAMKAVSCLPGIESVAVDMKEQKITVIGDVDPVAVVSKLRKFSHTELLTVGPPKEPEKKKEEPKKDEAKKDDDKNILDFVEAFRAYDPYMTQYYHVRSIEENPNACVIS